MKRLGIALVLAGTTSLALAKLPPLSEEAKAKAAETAAKAAWTDKVSSYQLCMAMDRVAARYLADAGKAGKAVQPTPTPACADPGPFVYAPPAAVSAAPAAPAAPVAPVAAAQPGPAPTAAKKP